MTYDGPDDNWLCPQCGFSQNIYLIEGICGTCHEENQGHLERHNYEYDAWQRMTPTEREAAIKRAI